MDQFDYELFGGHRECLIEKEGEMKSGFYIEDILTETKEQISENLQIKYYFNDRQWLRLTIEGGLLQIMGSSTVLVQPKSGNVVLIDTII